MTDQPQHDRLPSMSLGDHLEELRSRLILALAGLAVAALISSPWLFYQFWSFIAAGLYKHERQFVYKAVPHSS
jgi:Sec-independent protein secretion pathway component TatC